MQRKRILAFQHLKSLVPTPLRSLGKELDTTAKAIERAVTQHYGENISRRYTSSRIVLSVYGQKKESMSTRKQLAFTAIRYVVLHRMKMQPTKLRRTRIRWRGWCPNSTHPLEPDGCNFFRATTAHPAQRSVRFPDFLSHQMYVCHDNSWG